MYMYFMFYYYMSVLLMNEFPQNRHTQVNSILIESKISSAPRIGLHPLSRRNALL